jgi:hypothetical protein
MHRLSNRRRDITERLVALETLITAALRKPALTTASVTPSPSSSLPLPNSDSQSVGAIADGSSPVPSTLSSSSSIIADLNSQYKQIDDMLQVASLESLRREYATRLQRALRDIRATAVRRMQYNSLTILVTDCVIIIMQ